MNPSSYLSSARTRFNTTKTYVIAHKIRSAIIVIVVVVLAYWLWGITHPVVAQTRYVLGTVATGTIVSSVSESGQVSPSNEVTINPQASGQVTQVLVKNGQQVSTGQPLAYINATDEYNAVESAKASLESAQLSLQKLQEPATALQLTQDQDAVTKAQANLQTDQTNLQNDYTTAYSDVVSTFLDLPSIQSELQDIEIGTEASKGAQWNIDYYENAVENWDDLDAISGRTNTYNAYTAAAAAYTKAYNDFQATSPSSSTSTVNSILNETYTTVQAEQNALNSANSFIQFYENQVKNNNQTPSAEAVTSITTLSTDISKINSHLSALLADQNAITATKQSIVNDTSSITEDQETLQQLQAGADPLDIQSDQLNIQQQQQALTQAQDNLADYTITAPFSGTIAGLDLNVGDTVSTGTNIGTLITAQDLVDISVNEVDAAKITVGEQATLTFDAIPNLSLSGTVVNVNPLGAVTQGVVSYAIQIGFTTQDPRVKAGMTVNADIQTAVHQNVLTVPASAITTIGSATYVGVFNPPLTGSGVNSTSGVVSATPPTEVPVVVGITDNTTTEIDSGLTAGEQIVARTSSSATSKTTAASATTRGGFGGAGGAGGAAVRI